MTVLAKSGISTTGTTSIAGDIGISPAAASYITGFALSTPPTAFTTSSLVTGKVYAADYNAPAPANMTTAISDMETAYTDAAGRTLPDAAELGAGNISGMTLAPGLYKWGTGLLIDNKGVTLSGSANDVWIFQIAGALTVNSGAIVTLSGGAQAKNIFWQVTGQTTLGTTAQFKGNILDQTAIVLNTGAILDGRALAQTAVTMDSNAITRPAADMTPGAATKFVITGNSTQVKGAPAGLTITANDDGGDTAASYTGDKSLIFSGANSSTNPVMAPTVTDKSGLPIAFGSATTITFANGVATISAGNNGVMTLYKEETVNIVATEGIITTTGSNRLTVTVAGAVFVGNEWAPHEFSLSQNYPNPFNPSTTIQYSLVNAGMVSLKLYNVVGQEVATLVNGRKEAGRYTLTFNPSEGTTSLSNGVYFYRLEAGPFVSMKKLVLMK
ncbi:MAG: ice-binding family protein [Candidatus Latescibacterota bacterium]